MSIKLFIPGPTQVHPTVLSKMGGPMISHRSAEATKLQKSISDQLRTLMYTDNTIVLSTSSGTGLMEGAVRSFTRKKVAVFSVGSFGKRWAELAQLNGIACDLFEAADSMATLPEDIDKQLKTQNYDVVCVTHNETSSGIMNPIESISAVMQRYPDVIWMLDTVSSLGGIKVEVDRLGIDVCISSSQKALALPPGLALASVSEKAKNRLKELGQRGFYLDFLNLVKFVEEKDHQYVATPSLPHMYALDYQMGRILEEGLDNRFYRHIEMAEFMITWANEYFETFAAPGFESMTVTVIKNTRNVSIKELNAALEKRNMKIAGGYGKFKDSTFRIAHMGELTLTDMEEITSNIEDILKLRY